MTTIDDALRQVGDDSAPIHKALWVAWAALDDIGKGWVRQPEEYARQKAEQVAAISLDPPRPSSGSTP